MNEFVEDIKKVYLKYQKDVYFYLLSLTHDTSLAEDLCSETFLKAIQSIISFKGNSSVKTWLFGIARNLWLQSLRNKNIVQYEDFLVNYLEYDCEKQIFDKSTLKYISELIEKMEHRTQKIILMRIDGYSYKEISEQLDISENSARVIDFRARKRIKEILKQEGFI